MNDHSGEDPAGDVAGGIGRASSAIATQAARLLADRLRARAEERKAAKFDEAQRLAATWEADRAAAVAQVRFAGKFAGVTDADLRSTVEAWKTADAWAQVDPEFVDDEQTLRRQLQEGWGVDVDRPDERTVTPTEQASASSAGFVAEADAAAERAREREEDAAAHVDEATAAAVARGTAEEMEALDSAAQHRANAQIHETTAEYDSKDRRSQLAARVKEGGADQESTRARVAAANANAHPIKAAATAKKEGKPARGRRQAAGKDRTSQLGR